MYLFACIIVLSIEMILKPKQCCTLHHTIFRPPVLAKRPVALPWLEVSNWRNGVWTPFRYGVWTPFRYGVWTPFRYGVWTPFRYGVWTPSVQHKTFVALYKCHETLNNQKWRPTYIPLLASAPHCGSGTQSPASGAPLSVVSRQGASPVLW